MRQLMPLGRIVLAPEALWAGVAFLFGLVVGSFANVCIHRLPEGESVVRPRSRCPRCAAPIAARDNIPVLSYLMLRGRCRSCSAPISPRYPAIEAANGLLYAAMALKYGPPMQLAVLASPSAVNPAVFAGSVYGLLAWLLNCWALPTALLVLAVIDFEHHLLPNAITKPGIAAGLGVSAAASLPAPFGAFLVPRLCPPLCLPATVVECLVAALLGYLAVWLVYHAAKGYYRHVKGEDVEPLGFGDAKLLAMLGAFRGSLGLWTAGLLGTSLGALYGLAMVAARRAGRRTEIPLGTFLCAGALLELLAGGELLAWYRSLFPHP